MSLKRLTLSVCLLSLATQSQGAGLELNQHGVKELSHGFAGTATLLEDASAIAHNPAGLTRIEGHQFSGGLTALYADIDYDVDVFREKIENRYGLEPTRVKGSGDANSAQITPIPHLYYGYKVNEDTAVGIGVYAPFGSGSEFEENWAGRYHAEDTSQSTININPTFAVNLSDTVSIGGGPVIQFYEAELTNKIDVGYLVAEAVLKEAEEQVEVDAEIAQRVIETLDRLQEDRLPEGSDRVNAVDVVNEVEMDSIGYGFSFGILWEPTEKTRVGLNYRSRVQHIAEGETKRPTLDEVDIEGILAEELADRAGIPEDDARDAARTAVDERGAAAGDIFSRITFPEIATLSVHHDLTDRFALMGSLSYINWSVFDEIRLEHKTRNAGGFGDDDIPVDGGDGSGDITENRRGGSDITGSGDDVRRRDLVQPLEFEDTMRYGIGARYQFNDRLVLRTGASYDESPLTNSDFRTPRGPDNDRIIAGLGVSYQVDEQLNIDVGYAYTRIRSADVTAQENPAGTQHRAVGRTSSNLHNLGVQAVYNF